MEDPASILCESDAVLGHGRIDDLQVDPVLNRVDRVLVRGKGGVEAYAWAGIETFSPEARRVVLADASLAIAPGELAVLVGRSGSGKSTFLHLAAGLDLPERGRVELAGHDLAALSDSR